MLTKKWWKMYWNEVFLVVMMLIATYFFLKGSGINVLGFEAIFLGIIAFICFLSIVPLARVLTNFSQEKVT